jgi:starvation-inducible DNA-binding protein
MELHCAVMLPFRAENLETNFFKKQSAPKTAAELGLMKTQSTTTPVTKEHLSIGLSDQQRKHSAKLLSAILSDGALLYQKTRNYHWNVTGPHFHSLHLLLEAQYAQIAEEVDEVAERIRSLGLKAPGTYAEFIELSQLKEDAPSVHPDAMTMLKNLVSDHEEVISALRKAVEELSDHVDDQGTADFVTGLMEAHEKTAWMLRSHLE